LRANRAEAANSEMPDRLEHGSNLSLQFAWLFWAGLLLRMIAEKKSKRGKQKNWRKLGRGRKPAQPSIPEGILGFLPLTRFYRARQKPKLTY
jgi:hypothetical protein